MAKKVRTAYVCGECGADYPKWQGQCSACQAWETLSAVRIDANPSQAAANRRSGYAGKAHADAPAVTALGAVSIEDEQRSQVGIGEFDRVLGGGLVRGSVVLVGGEPGIGKSTLLLQAVAALGERLPSLYVTGEESLAQVAQRARRLGLDHVGIDGLAETCVERIIEAAQSARPGLLVVDSIQTLWSETLPAAPGSVSQVRETAAQLTRFAKSSGTVVFMIGHVTKDGGIAGPRVLEHMVDAVLYFESDAGSRMRILRAFKNRFGAVNELGVFAMADVGLREVPNPSAMFVSGASNMSAGSAVLVTREGTRPLLVEVQALVDRSGLANPGRVAVGLDQTRLSMLLAILHRHAGVAAFDQDVFVNVVGGLRISETAADLAVILAVVSSLRDKPLPAKTVAFAEAGLAGELRPVANGEERLREAAKLGYKRAIIARGNAPKGEAPAGLEIVACKRLDEAIERSFDS